MSNDSPYVPTCFAYQEDLLIAIDKGTVLSPCLACTNSCLVANHPHRPTESTGQYLQSINQSWHAFIFIILCRFFCSKKAER